MEASALQHRGGLSASASRSPLLRLRSDEQLIAMTRRGNQSAFEMLVRRYEPRLLAFCRHMLSSKEDAEDVLQEVFAASYNALLADNRPINTRPWLYRIARNRCLNHLRKPKPSGQDSMDIFERDNGTSTADTVHTREEFRQIVADVGLLPETQRSALLLREIDALSYEQIAEAMDTTVPSVKSLLVRARMSLAEAAEARLLTCGEVRLELGQVAEGIAKTSAPVRRHLKTCPQCRAFRSELRKTNRALAAIYPIAPLIILHKIGLAKIFGGGAAAGAGAGAAASGGTVAGGAAGIAAGGAVAGAGGAAAAGGAISAITGTIAGKAAAGMAAAAIVTAGAVEVNHVRSADPAPPQTPAVAVHPAPPASGVAPAADDDGEDEAEKPKGKARSAARPAGERERENEKPEADEPEAETEPPPAPVETPPTTTTPAAPVPPPVQEEEGTVTLPPVTPPPTTPPTTTPVAPPKPPPAPPKPVPTPPTTTTPAPVPPPTATVPPPTTTTPNGAAPAPPPPAP